MQITTSLYFTKKLQVLLIVFLSFVGLMHRKFLFKPISNQAKKKKKNENQYGNFQRLSVLI
jgi:hypothetical protein